MKKSQVPKVVLITGGSSGFGKVCVDHLAGCGHRVYGTSRRARFPTDRNTTQLPLIIPMDVCDENSVAAAVDMITKNEHNGADPRKLAVLLSNIIGQKRVQTHYLVGMYFQKMAVWARRILPASMFEKLIMSHYKIRD